MYSGRMNYHRVNYSDTGERLVSYTAIVWVIHAMLLFSGGTLRDDRITAGKEIRE